jgi:GNAT superfamily N-acetyltransferase
MIKIKLADENDIPDVCCLVQQMSPGFTHDYKNSIQKFLTCIKSSPDYFLWVAVLDDKVVGTAMMHLQHKLSYHCGTAAHLEDVVVDRDFRGQGIGELLVQTAIDKAREKSCYKIILGCYEKTAPYYEKFGFERHDIGMRMNLVKEIYPEKRN